MNIYTFKLSKKKALSIVALIVIILAAIILAVPSGDAHDRPVETANPVTVKNDGDKEAFLNSLGYTVEHSQQLEVTIPEVFDEVYEMYNEIQKQAGFDLSEYKGKQATLCTYRVTNYPDDREVMIDLLVYNEEIIGGAVYTSSIDGFMHGLIECPTTPQ